MKIDGACVCRACFRFGVRPAHRRSALDARAHGNLSSLHLRRVVVYCATQAARNHTGDRELKRLDLTVKENLAREQFTLPD